MDEKVISEEEIVDMADFFKVFGDPTRLRILCSVGKRRVQRRSYKRKGQNEPVCSVTAVEDSSFIQTCEIQERGKDHPL